MTKLGTPNRYAWDKARSHKLIFLSFFRALFLFFEMSMGLLKHGNVKNNGFLESFGTNPFI